MDNPEKLATQDTQVKDKTKQKHNTKELGQKKINRQHEPTNVKY